MDSSHAPKSLRGLLLRHRGRTGLFQRDLARIIHGAGEAGLCRVRAWRPGQDAAELDR